MELMKQNHLLKIGFVIFLKGAPFSDFIGYRLLNYMPSGIQICIPLFWGNFFQLGSSLIKQCLVYNEQLRFILLWIFQVALKVKLQKTCGHLELFMYVMHKVVSV